MVAKKRVRLIAVHHGQKPFAAVTDTAGDGDGEDELPDRDRGDAREEHENLERRRRRQQRGDDHDAAARTSETAAAPVDVALVKAPAEKRLAALPCNVVQREASRDRSSRRHERVVQEPLLVLRHHPDDEEVVHLGKREKRGIEKADEKKAGASPREREPSDPLDETVIPTSVDET